MAEALLVRQPTGANRLDVTSMQRLLIGILLLEVGLTRAKKDRRTLASTKDDWKTIFPSAKVGGTGW